MGIYIIHEFVRNMAGNMRKPYRIYYITFRILNFQWSTRH